MKRLTRKWPLVWALALLCLLCLSAQTAHAGVKAMLPGLLAAFLLLSPVIWAQYQSDAFHLAASGEEFGFAPMELIYCLFFGRYSSACAAASAAPKSPWPSSAAIWTRRGSSALSRRTKPPCCKAPGGPSSCWKSGRMRRALPA